MKQVQEKYQISQRRACRAIQISQRVARYIPTKRPDEDSLCSRIIELACNYGRYGYRRITSLLRAEGWHVNHKRVERIWRQEGLKVPQKTAKAFFLFLCTERRLTMNDCQHVSAIYNYSSGRMHCESEKEHSCKQQNTGFAQKIGTP